MAISKQDIIRIEAYMNTTFGTSSISLRERPKAEESAEVLLNGEFIGVIYKDEEDGETSYDFNMAILSEDLPKMAG